MIEGFFAWLELFNAWIRGLIDAIITWVQVWQGVGVFLGVMIETFIAPIPSPIVMMAAGAFLTIGFPPHLAVLSILFNVMLIGAFAVTVGSFFGYGIAYFGGYPIIERFGKYLGTSIDEIEYMRSRMEESSRDEIYLFTARAVPIIPLSIVSLLYGALRADWKRFALVTFLGALPRCLILGIAGWILGAGYLLGAEMIDLFETVILLFLLLFFIIFILYRIIIRRRVKHAKMQESEVNESTVEPATS